MVSGCEHGLDLSLVSDSKERMEYFPICLPRSHYPDTGLTQQFELAHIFTPEKSPALAGFEPMQLGQVANAWTVKQQSRLHPTYTCKHNSELLLPNGIVQINIEW